MKTMMGQVLLTPGQVERIHEASLEILENVGVLVHNSKARARDRDKGQPGGVFR